MSRSIRPSPRDAITEAAFEVLADDPTASLSQIAARAGVGRATLHRYFAGREDLVRSLALRAVEEMDEAAEASCAGVESHHEALRRSLSALIPLGDRYRFIHQHPVEEDREISAAFARQTAETLDAVEKAKAEGFFDAAVPSTWIAQTYEHLLYAAWESLRAGQVTANQAADLAWRTLTIGVGAQR